VIQQRFLLCFLGFGTLMACSGSGATVVDPVNQDPSVNILPGAVNQDPPTNGQRPPTNNQSASSVVGSGPMGGGQGGGGNRGPGGDSGTGNAAGSGTGTCSTSDSCATCDQVNDCLGSCNCFNQLQLGTTLDCPTVCAAQ